MLEMMLAAGGASRFYPDSGPGSKKLVAGNEDLGFFGTLTYVEFGAAALAAIKKYTSTQDFAFSYFTADTTNVWYKFFLRKKVIYIPLRPIGKAAYYRLLAAGMVAGEDTPGGAGGYSAVDQGARAFIADDKTYPLRIRLARKTILDKIITGDQIFYGAADTQTSETAVWGRMMAGSLGAGGWPAKPSSTDTYYANPLNTVAEGMNASQNSMMNSVMASATNTSAGVFTNDYEWRPVLELLPGELTAPRLVAINPIITGDGLMANSAYVDSSETLNRLNVEFAGANMSTSTPYQKREDDAAVLPAIFVETILSTKSTVPAYAMQGELGSEFTTPPSLLPTWPRAAIDMGSEITALPGGVLPNTAKRSA